jgi:hypothetical protein
MSAIANQKFNQLHLQGHQPLQNPPEERTAMRAPTRTQEPEDPAPYNIPCQEEAAKETDASPQFLIHSPYPHHYFKEKNGGMTER